MTTKFLLLTHLREKLSVVYSDITNCVILRDMDFGQVDMLEKSVVGVGVVGNRSCRPGDLLDQAI